MFIKPGIDFTNSNGAYVSSSILLAENIITFRLEAITTNIKRKSKKDAEHTGHPNRRNARGDCMLVTYDTMQETEAQMIEKHGNFNEIRFSYSRIKQDDEDEELDIKFDFSNKPSTSTTEQSSYPTSSSCDDEPNKNNPSNLKRTRRIRARKFKPESSTPSEDESQQEDDFLQTVTLKSLAERFQYENPHKCSRKGCPYKFASYDIRDQHLRCHAESDPTQESTDGSAKAGMPRKRFSFKCSQCDGKFDSWKPCLMHVWREHQIDLGMLRCPVCEKRFVYTVHVFKHLQTHRLNKTLDISCRMCDKKFVNTSQRSVHEALHLKKETYEEEDELEVNEKPRWYAERRCNICKHMFSNSKILSKHIKTVHLKIKPFVCNVCGYKCARKATLNIHIRQHSGLKPLTCKSCTFRTADPSALSYHERRHRNERAYQCKTCGIKVVQPSALRCHIQSQHPQEYQQMKCTLCDYASINAQNLKRHQANHKAGLIKTIDEDSQLDCDNEREHDHRVQHGMNTTGNGRQPQNAPEISFDCFLPLESVDSVVHDSGGITIPAAVVTLPAALSEETQFPI
uniref:C2H2-type domain-containing protein n=1 Tax=Anopheles minimus TaxID=112268 RepID=A0A182WC40_9DIPT